MENFLVLLLLRSSYYSPSLRSYHTDSNCISNSRPFPQKKTFTLSFYGDKKLKTINQKIMRDKLKPVKKPEGRSSQRVRSTHPFVFFHAKVSETACQWPLLTLLRTCVCDSIKNSMNTIFSLYMCDIDALSDKKVKNDQFFYSLLNHRGCSV